MRPNNIELRLIGCNPGSQLCPEITETRLDPPREDQYAALRAAAADARANSQGATQLAAVKAALTKALDAVAAASQPADAKSVNPDAQRKAEEALAQATAMLTNAGTTVEAAQKDTAGYADAGTWQAGKSSAAIGVSLVASVKSTAPATALKVGDTGKIIVIKAGGAGAFGITVAKIPAGDSPAVTFAGANVTSVTDPNGKTLTYGANGYSLSQIGVYQVQVSGLMPGLTVVANIQDYIGAAARGDPQPLAFAAFTDAHAEKLSTTQ